MAKYKLSKEAREDLIQIFRHGVVRFGQIQAEKYYDSLFEMFHFIAENPYLFKEVNKIRLD
jgi:toxin ParE1/3/4